MSRLGKIKFKGSGPKKIGFKSAKVRRRRTWDNRSSSAEEPPEEPSVNEFLLEDGASFLLLEDGNRLLLEG